jgi:hypothetical protein
VGWLRATLLGGRGKDCISLLKEDEGSRMRGDKLSGLLLNVVATLLSHGSK